MLEFSISKEKERREKKEEKSEEIIIEWMEHDPDYVTNPSQVIVGECEEADSD